jgi:hypothetical protein
MIPDAAYENLPTPSGGICVNLRPAMAGKLLYSSHDTSPSSPANSLMSAAANPPYIPNDCRAG